MSHPLGTTRGRGSRRHPEPPIWTAELVRQHCFTLWARDPAGAQFPEPQDRPAVLVQIEIWRRVPAQRRGQRGRPGSSGFVETVEVVDFERPNPELPPPPEFSDEARRYAYVAAQLNARRVRVPAATDM